MLAILSKVQLIKQLTYIQNMALIQFWTLPGVLKIWVPSIKKVFWNFEGYYIQFLEFTGHPHITFVPLEIFTVP